MKKRILCLVLSVCMLLGTVVLPSDARAASAMTASEDALAIIKKFEGFSGTPYVDTDGHYTIGYGTRCPEELVEQYKETPMTVEEADAELRKAVTTYEKDVNAFIDRYGLSYGQQQFDALISLVFNIGAGWLRKGETLMKALTSGATGNDLVYAFSIYSMSGGRRSLGHIRRRLAESCIYLEGIYSSPAPDRYCYVLYDAQGGTISAMGGTYNVQGYNGELTATPVATASRTGYVFSGWYTKSSGGSKVELLDMSTKGMTLYAHWEPDPNAPPEETTPTTPSPSEPEGDAIDPVQVKVTASKLNIRGGPGLSYATVGSVNRGAQVTVSRISRADGYTWGQCDQGWIALENTDYFNVTGPTEPDPTEPVPTEPETTAPKPTDPAPTDPAPTEPETTVPTTTTPKPTDPVPTDPTPTEPETTVPTTTAPKPTDPSPTDPAPTEPETTVPPTTQPAPTEPAPTEPQVPEGTPIDPVEVTVQGVWVNLRKGPGLNFDVIGNVSRGKKLTVSATFEADGYLWGKFDKGWVSLDHTNYEELTKVPEVPEEPELPETPTMPEAGKKLYATVVNTASLNVRKVPQGAVVSMLHEGDRVQILEQTIVDGSLWGRFERGWISMRTYVTLEVVEDAPQEVPTEPTVPEQPPTEPTQPEEPPLVSEPKTGTFAVVVGTSSVAVRQEKDGTVTGKLAPGARVELLEQDGAWGRCAQGWIRLVAGVKLEQELVPEDAEVPAASVIRTFASVQEDGQVQVYDAPDGTAVAKMAGDARSEILEYRMSGGVLWGRCEEGWIGLKEAVELETAVDQAEPDDPTATFCPVEVQAACLNVRGGLGNETDVVCRLYTGSVVAIRELAPKGTAIWARTDLGWINMDNIA